jgi:hypothetical protein
MLDILTQIEQAKNAGLYYVALFSALSVPDIAGALDSPNGVANGQRYADWFDRHVGPKYLAQGTPTLCGMDCYYFRCSMLHQGTAQLQNPKAQFSRVFFVQPGHQWLRMHNNVTHGALNIDLNTFCQDIIDAGRAWHALASTTNLYLVNAAKCVTLHPHGLAPYVGGVPCIG